MSDTPPDFDAALNDAVVTYASKMALVRNHPDRELFHERFLAARQRVRELHEAVVRERDGLRAAPQGEVYEVERITPRPMAPAFADPCCVHVGPAYRPGDKVRVTKVEL